MEIVQSLCVVFSFILNVNAKTEIPPCVMELSINITDGEFNGSSIIKNEIVYDSKNYFQVDNVIYGCICNIKPCIRKCCGQHKIMEGRRCKPSNSTQRFPVYDRTSFSNYSGTDFYFIYGTKCKTNRTLLLPHKKEEDKFYLQRDGSLFLPFADRKFLKPHEYCIDIFDNEYFQMDYLLSAILCLDKNVTIEVPSAVFISTGMIIY